tara:strand:- start:681 stop:5726 length:5046 start_codon:yes stop_codon:yes gene_type:complete
MHTLSPENLMQLPASVYSTLVQIDCKYLFYGPPASHSQPGQTPPGLPIVFPLSLDVWKTPGIVREDVISAMNKLRRGLLQSRHSLLPATVTQTKLNSIESKITLRIFEHVTSLTKKNNVVLDELYEHTKTVRDKSTNQAESMAFCTRSDVAARTRTIIAGFIDAIEIVYTCLMCMVQVVDGQNATTQDNFEKMYNDADPGKNEDQLVERMDRFTMHMKHLQLMINYFSKSVPNDAGEAYVYHNFIYYAINLPSNFPATAAMRKSSPFQVLFDAASFMNGNKGKLFQFCTPGTDDVEYKMLPIQTFYAERDIDMPSAWAPAEELALYVAEVKANNSNMRQAIEKLKMPKEANASTEEGKKVAQELEDRYKCAYFAMAYLVGKNEMLKAHYTHFFPGFLHALNKEKVTLTKQKEDSCFYQCYNDIRGNSEVVTSEQGKELAYLYLDYQHPRTKDGVLIQCGSKVEETKCFLRVLRAVTLNDVCTAHKTMGLTSKDLLPRVVVENVEFHTQFGKTPVPEDDPLGKKDAQSLNRIAIEIHKQTATCINSIDECASKSDFSHCAVAGLVEGSEEYLKDSSFHPVKEACTDERAAISALGVDKNLLETHKDACSVLRKILNAIDNNSHAANDNVPEATKTLIQHILSTNCDPIHGNETEELNSTFYEKFRVALGQHILSGLENRYNLHAIGSDVFTQQFTRQLTQAELRHVSQPRVLPETACANKKDLTVAIQFVKLFNLTGSPPLRTAFLTADLSALDILYYPFRGLVLDHKLTESGIFYGRPLDSAARLILKKDKHYEERKLGLMSHAYLYMQIIVRCLESIPVTQLDDSKCLTVLNELTSCLLSEPVDDMLTFVDRSKFLTSAHGDECRASVFNKAFVSTANYLSTITNLILPLIENTIDGTTDEENAMRRDTYNKLFVSCLSRISPYAIYEPDKNTKKSAIGIVLKDLPFIDFGMLMKKSIGTGDNLAIRMLDDMGLERAKLTEHRYTGMHNPSETFPLLLRKDFIKNYRVAFNNTRQSSTPTGRGSSIMPLIMMQTLGMTNPNFLQTPLYAQQCSKLVGGGGVSSLPLPPSLVQMVGRVHNLMTWSTNDSGQEMTLFLQTLTKRVVEIRTPLLREIIGNIAKFNGVFEDKTFASRYTAPVEFYANGTQVTKWSEMQEDDKSLCLIPAAKVIPMNDQIYAAPSKAGAVSVQQPSGGQSRSNGTVNIRVPKGTFSTLKYYTSATLQKTKTWTKSMMSTIAGYLPVAAGLANYLTVFDAATVLADDWDADEDGLPLRSMFPMNKCFSEFAFYLNKPNVQEEYERASRERKERIAAENDAALKQDLILLSGSQLTFYKIAERCHELQELEFRFYDVWKTQTINRFDFLMVLMQVLSVNDCKQKFSNSEDDIIPLSVAACASLSTVPTCQRSDSPGFILSDSEFIDSFSPLHQLKSLVFDLDGYEMTDDPQVLDLAVFSCNSHKQVRDFGLRRDTKSVPLDEPNTSLDKLGASLNTIQQYVGGFLDRNQMEAIKRQISNWTDLMCLVGTILSELGDDIDRVAFLCAYKKQKMTKTNSMTQSGQETFSMDFDLDSILMRECVLNPLYDRENIIFSSKTIPFRLIKDTSPEMRKLVEAHPKNMKNFYHLVDVLYRLTEDDAYAQRIWKEAVRQGDSYTDVLNERLRTCLQAAEGDNKQPNWNVAHPTTI